MLRLILVIIIILGIVIARRYLAQMREQRLRDNPPERRVIEVSLPRGVDDAAKRMPTIYRKIAQAASGDKKTREVGLRQVDIIYLAERASHGGEPELRFLVYADPDRMDAVKRAIRNAFDGMADVVEVKGDPLAPLISGLRPESPEQAAGEALPPELQAQLEALVRQKEAEQQEQEEESS